MYLHYIFNVSVSEANALDLSSILKEYMIEIYEENQKNENNNMDITYDDMVEYYDAGVKCLEWLRTNRTKYFSTKKYKLIGIEYPIYTVLDEYNVGFLQKLDIVLQDKVTKKYLIIDLKTSKKSWNDFKKKDDVIRAQLLFYKIYFSKKNNIDIDDVDVVFYILKKEVPNPDDYDFEIKVSYLQRVEVPDGKVRINKANKLLNNFLLECFSTDGKYIIEKEYDKLKGRNNFNCTYCAYNDNLYCDEKLRK